MSSTAPCTHQSKALTNDSSLASPQSDGTGDQLLPSPTYEAAASQFVSASINTIKELCLPRPLTGSNIGRPSPRLRFHRRLPAGTTRLHTPLLAHWGQLRLRWAAAADVTRRWMGTRMCPLSCLPEKSHPSDVDIHPHLVMPRLTSIRKRPSVWRWRGQARRF
jgi:hypothetical protein